MFVAFAVTAVGMPAEVVEQMRQQPFWPAMEAVAPTLRYDAAVMGDSQEGKPLPSEMATQLGAINVPTLVMDGGESPTFLRTGAKAVADAIPGAEYRTLPGQTHEVAADVISPIMAVFFKD
jgi:pimeloyl-ACP methyl ester carboxylesterase